MSVGREVGLGPRHIVLDGDPAPQSPPPTRGTAAPQILAYVCYGQTAGWIKMPLSMEVGLGPGNIVLDGNSARPPQGGTGSFVHDFTKCCPILSSSKYVIVVIKDTTTLHLIMKYLTLCPVLLCYPVFNWQVFNFCICSLFPFEHCAVCFN